MRPSVVNNSKNGCNFGRATRYAVYVVSIFILGGVSAATGLAAHFNGKIEKNRDLNMEVVESVARIEERQKAIYTSIEEIKSHLSGRSP